MDKKLFISAIAKFAAGFILVGLLLFVPAGTLGWWQGWLFMGILDWDRGRLIRDEVLSYYALRLLIGLSFSAEFLAIAVKRWLKARSER